MNVGYSLHEIEFEWDRGKASANLRKHRVSFESACEAFFDPFLRVVEAGNIEGQSREAVIGMNVNWRLLYVVYVVRDDVVRLISARLAERVERELYEDQ